MVCMNARIFSEEDNLFFVKHFFTKCINTTYNLKVYKKLFINIFISSKIDYLIVHTHLIENVTPFFVGIIEPEVVNILFSIPNV